jgi:hypothetical protein
LAPAPFILKGGGWYVTDYPSESRKKAMDAEKKPAAAESGTSGKGPDGAKGSSSASGDSKAADSKPASTASPTTD